MRLADQPSDRLGNHVGVNARRKDQKAQFAPADERTRGAYRHQNATSMLPRAGLLLGASVQHKTRHSHDPVSYTHLTLPTN